MTTASSRIAALQPVASWLLIVLVVVLRINGPGLMIGFDYAAR